MNSYIIAYGAGDLTEKGMALKHMITNILL